MKGAPKTASVVPFCTFPPWNRSSKAAVHHCTGRTWNACPVLSLSPENVACFLLLNQAVAPLTQSSCLMPLPLLLTSCSSCTAAHILLTTWYCCSSYLAHHTVLLKPCCATCLITVALSTQSLCRMPVSGWPGSPATAVPAPATVTAKTVKRGQSHLWHGLIRSSLTNSAAAWSTSGA